MRIPFCDIHIQAFFTLYQDRLTPLDQALHAYFKAHKSLGANDRRTIGDAVYGLVRWKILCDWACGSAPILERLAWYRSPLFEKARADRAIPENIRLAVPEWFWQKICSSFGEKKARVICNVFTTNPPVTIRANTLKTTRDDLLRILEKQFSVSPCSSSPTGIFFHKREPLFSLPEFKEGLFEMQDEGSQLAAALVSPSPGDIVLDFCSGSGGKTLAFAPRLAGKGQIYLHDIRERALAEAKKRLYRAGIQNAQCLLPHSKQLARLKKKCDWVLVDVPCSGTGVLRRNPEQKWRLHPEMITRLAAEQQKIMHAAVSYLKPEGKLVYITCSILAEENQEQVKKFLASLPLLLESPPLILLPQEGGMDGFFAAVFRKKESVIYSGAC